jgi:LuxR family maltose regulon positive regulatory protein
LLDQAVDLLGRLYEAADRAGWVNEKIHILILRALAEEAQGREDAALGVMLQALVLAEPGGYIRLFVDEGDPMRMLIADFRFSIEKQMSNSAHAQLGYTGKLLGAFAPPVIKQSTTPALAAGASVNNPKSEMVEPLSPRELEILHLLADGLSNREISERLFLALDTVKGHNRRIYDKLQVQSRTEAIARARELTLL